MGQAHISLYNIYHIFTRYEFTHTFTRKHASLHMRNIHIPTHTNHHRLYHITNHTTLSSNTNGTNDDGLTKSVRLCLHGCYIIPAFSLNKAMTDDCSFLGLTTLLNP